MTKFLDNACEIASAAQMLNPCNSRIYIATALKGDVPIDESGYLAMVNEKGDRVAVKTPGSLWNLDLPPIRGYSPAMPAYKHAVCVFRIRLENK